MKCSHCHRGTRKGNRPCSFCGQHPSEEKSRESKIPPPKILSRQERLERIRKRTQKKIRRGVLVRPKRCGQCHSSCKPEAHHLRPLEDPDDIAWLCTKCHDLAHGHNFPGSRRVRLSLRGADTTNMIRNLDERNKCSICRKQYPSCGASPMFARSHPDFESGQDGNIVIQCAELEIDMTHSNVEQIIAEPKEMKIITAGGAGNPEVPLMSLPEYLSLRSEERRVGKEC